MYRARVYVHVVGVLSVSVSVSVFVGVCVRVVSSRPCRQAQANVPRFVEEPVPVGHAAASRRACSKAAGCVAGCVWCADVQHSSRV